MGSHREPQLVVARARELRRALPLRAALEVLDEAMLLMDGVVDPEWEAIDPNYPDHVHPDYADETLPPSPFAEILRQAFAPDLDASELEPILLDGSGTDDYAEEQRCVDALNLWEQRVFGPFYIRYGLPWIWFPAVCILDRPENFKEPPISREVWLTRFAGHLMTWGGKALSAARATAQSAYIADPSANPCEVALSGLDALHRSIYDSYHTPGAIAYVSWIAAFENRYMLLTGKGLIDGRSAATDAWLTHHTQSPESAAALIAGEQK